MCFLQRDLSFLSAGEAATREGIDALRDVEDDFDGDEQDDTDYESPDDGLGPEVDESEGTGRGDAEPSPFGRSPLGLSFGRRLCDGLCEAYMLVRGHVTAM